MTAEILGTHNEGRRLSEFNIHRIHQRQDNLRTARNLFFVCKWRNEKVTNRKEKLK